MTKPPIGALGTWRFALALALAMPALTPAPPALAGDPTVETQVIRLAAQAAGTPSIYVPTAAHLGGAAGSFWLTELEVHNYGTSAIQYEIALLKRDNANSTPTTRNYTLEAGKSFRFNDALMSVFGFTGAASLRLTPLAAQAGPVGDERLSQALGTAGYTLHVTSRTYNDPSGGSAGLAEGCPPADDLALAGGTYGQFVPGQWDSLAVTEIDEGRLIELTHTAGTTTTGFRTNIGAVNTSAESITVEIELILANGTSLGKVDLPLRPFEYKQIDKIFERVTSETVADGFAILRLKSGTGSFLGYASVIDNRTGDPIYVPCARFERTGGPPTFGSLTFGTEVDANYNITNPATSFPAGTTKIWVSYNYSGLVAGSSYTTTWYLDGSLWSTSSNTAYGSSGKVTMSRSVSSGYSTGTYRFEIVYNSAVMTSGQFTVGL